MLIRNENKEVGRPETEDGSKKSQEPRIKTVEKRLLKSLDESQE
jgi:hypothetical protein